MSAVVVLVPALAVLTVGIVLGAGWWTDRFLAAGGRTYSGEDAP